MQREAPYTRSGAVMDKSMARLTTGSAALLTVSFTCAECRARVTRFVRGDPSDVWRCFGCEAQLTRRVSERLLGLVFGTAEPDDSGHA